MHIPESLGEIPCDVNSGIAFRNFKQTAYYLEVTEYGLLAGVSNMYICSTLLLVLEGPCTAVNYIQNVRLGTS